MSLVLLANLPFIDIEMPQVKLTRWDPPTPEDEGAIVHKIDQGISALTTYVDPKKFKNTFHPDKDQVTNYDPDWWRYKGVRMNFAVLCGIYLVCYKCNKLIRYKSLQELTRHLDSLSHKESNEVFYSSGSLPSKEFKFPIAKGYSTKASYHQLYECPFIQQWRLHKRLSSSKIRTVETKAKREVRDKFFNY